MSPVRRRSGPNGAIAARLARFREDRAGGALVLVSLLGVVLIGFTAVGVDGADFFLARRHQQAATDMAAIAAASALEQAAARTASVMSANGYPAAALDVATGTYLPDPTLDPARRFTASTGTNAVRVTATTTQPFIFGGAFQALLGGTGVAGRTGFAIRTEAVARKQDSAAFTLGTGLASLDGGLLNALLGSLIGAKLSLSALEYQALANASVDMFDVGDALAARLGTGTTTYGALGAGTAPPAALFASLADALAGRPAASAAVRTVMAALPPMAAVAVATLVDYGPAASLAIGAPHPSSARVSALDLLTALVRLGNGGHLATASLGAMLPGLVGVQMSLVVGEPPQGSAFFAMGPETTTLHSAQLRLQLSTEVGGAGLPATMILPIYLELAPATATVASIACGNGAAQAAVTLNVATGVAGAALGTVRPTDMTDLSASPPVAPATLIDLLGLLRVTAAAQASVANPGSIAVRYTADDIRAGTQKTVSTTPSLVSLLNGLAADTRVTVSLLGLMPPQPGLPAAVRSAIAATLTPLDLALERLLPLLGLAVGNATTAVKGVRCGQGRLVN